jgi:anti-repressor protein
MHKRKKYIKMKEGIEVENNLRNELQLFKHEEFGNVRVVTVNGEPWFVAKDVAIVLGYSNAQDAIRTHCRKARNFGDLDGGIEIRTPAESAFEPPLQLHTKLISENDVYRLITRSHLPQAERFQDWVFEEVLPTIRKTGSYSVIPQFPQTYIEALEALLISEKEKEQLALENKDLWEINIQQEDQLIEQAPKVEFTDHILEASNNLDMNEFAKILQNETIITGRNRLFKWLREEGYLMGEPNNLPYQQYMNQGLFAVVPYTIPTPFGIKEMTKTLVTPKGQVYFIGKLRKLLI